MKMKGYGPVENYVINSQFKLSLTENLSKNCSGQNWPGNLTFNIVGTKFEAENFNLDFRFHVSFRPTNFFPNNVNLYQFPAQFSVQVNFYVYF